jgi:hypothetical protein
MVFYPACRHNNEYSNEENHMKSHVLFVIIPAGVAGFFWGASLYEFLGKTSGHTETAVFCACAASISTYFAARRL